MRRRPVRKAARWRPGRRKWQSRARSRGAYGGRALSGGDHRPGTLALGERQWRTAGEGSECRGRRWTRRLSGEGAPRGLRG